MRSVPSRPESKCGLLLPRCGLCQKVPEHGIAGGLKLKQLFVCQECEKLILNIEIGTPGYEKIMKQIRRIFGN